MRPDRFAVAVCLTSAALLAACERKAPEAADTKQAAASAPPAAAAAPEPAASAPAAAPAPAPETALQPNPERNAYFGETHLHTSWSVDAWVMGTG